MSVAAGGEFAEYGNRGIEGIDPISPGGHFHRPHFSLVPNVLERLGSGAVLENQPNHQPRHQRETKHMRPMFAHHLLVQRVKYHGRSRWGRIGHPIRRRERSGRGLT